MVSLGRDEGRNGERGTGSARPPSEHLFLTLRIASLSGPVVNRHSFPSADDSNSDDKANPRIV